jgi:hypothetical protein
MGKSDGAQDNGEGKVSQIISAEGGNIQNVLQFIASIAGTPVQTLLIAPFMAFLVLQWCGICQILICSSPLFKRGLGWQCALVQSCLCPLFFGLPALSGLTMGILTREKRLTAISLVAGISSVVPFVLAVLNAVVLFLSGYWYFSGK